MNHPNPPPPLAKDPPDADQLAPRVADAAAATPRDSRVLDRVVAEADAVVEAEGGVEKRAAEEGVHPMDTGDGPPPTPATVFRIRLKQPPSSLRHKMRVPELCRNFRSLISFFF